VSQSSIEKADIKLISDEIVVDCEKTEGKGHLVMYSLQLYVVLN
jgi:hypothetical protein